MINTKTTQVTLIYQKGVSVLVQYVDNGALMRKYVPQEKFIPLKADPTRGVVADEVIQYAIPYGFPWEDVELKFDNLKFANELRNLGIWTAADALKNPNGLWSALRAALAETLSKILVEARHENRRTK